MLASELVALLLQRIKEFGDHPVVTDWSDNRALKVTPLDSGSCEVYTKETTHEFFIE